MMVANISTISLASYDDGLNCCAVKVQAAETRHYYYNESWQSIWPSPFELYHLN